MSNTQAALDELERIDAVHRECENRQRSGLRALVCKLFGRDPCDEMTRTLRQQIDQKRKGLERLKMEEAGISYGMCHVNWDPERWTMEAVDGVGIIFHPKEQAK